MGEQICHNSRLKAKSKNPIDQNSIFFNFLHDYIKIIPQNHSQILCRDYLFKFFFQETYTLKQKKKCRTLKTHLAIVCQSREKKETKGAPIRILTPDSLLYQPRLTTFRLTWKVLIGETCIIQVPHSNIWENKICHNSRLKPKINNPIDQNSIFFIFYMLI